MMPFMLALTNMVFQVAYGSFDDAKEALNTLGK